MKARVIESREHVSDELLYHIRQHSLLSFERSVQEKLGRLFGLQAAALLGMGQEDSQGRSYSIRGVVMSELDYTHVLRVAEKAFEYLNAYNPTTRVHTARELRNAIAELGEIEC